MESEFHAAVKQLINEQSRENGSNTPDFLLASYLEGALNLFEGTIVARESWHGRELKKNG